MKPPASRPTIQPHQERAVAAEAEQQLSLTAALGLAEEPQPAPQPAPEPGPTRPRSRQRQAAPAAPPAATTASSSPDSDLPPWHHHGLVAPEQLTPMLRHYVELKAAHPDRVLLYRLGDFFECFFEDAITLSRLLELTLTGKEGGKAVGRVPMAGIPHHAAERYCAELVRRGLSVALCDQLESTPAKGELLKRGITRVLTPGTVLEEGLLAARLNNWLCAVVMEGACWGLAVADVSTGEFRVTERSGSAGLHQELLQVEAAEVLWPGATASASATPCPTWCPEALRLTPLPRTPFEAPEASATLKQRFGLASLDGLGLGEAPLALRAAGGLVAYLDDTCQTRVPLDPPTTWQAGDQLVLDAATRRNLELTKTQLGGSVHGSLLWALDRTHTAMGGRCLRRWLQAPLVERPAILERQGGVSELVADRGLRLTLRRLLRPMGDLERLAGRAGAGSASARDLVALADGLERLPQLAAQLAKATSAPLQALARPWPELESLAGELRHALLDTPPLSLTEGGLFHDGVDPALDELRNQLDDQDTWLAQQESEERRLSGLSSLKLQYHRTFGYFLAVSKAKAAAVPEHWIRRQTLANEERFVTPALRNREGAIQQLKARAAQREYELFCALRIQVGDQAAAIRTAARLVAELDAIGALAEVAATSGYCCPEITDPAGPEARLLQIEAGRHPVVEQLLVEEPFTANSVVLGAIPEANPKAAPRPDLIILTGPNASGKSCYLRQTGLLQLMAQMGSWIPATSARLGIADRLFTRVGAGDDLAAGQSTFMVEMAETANILHHASERSLVLLDEIGRGTATFDGLSIAWAVAEHLATPAERGGIRARSIFATHYHELNALAGQLANVANAQVLVQETGDALIFLHQVAPGGASRSYGIEAARLAGVPAAVVLRARQVLGRIEANSVIQVDQDEPSGADGALAA
ncbi:MULTISPECIES: DNA mismatch repair protein MutS [Cyanobium]|uniref:DNA mismatch repair protein MutS n=1 Tax=Cyanobium usitatum str. Tous TaxID=2116684 RepID=A0A2P7MTX6_9CYAN|nr:MULTISPECIES: DNA mismatch repair protein MutS [Cyanobium]MCP9781180.1 DNA mismatch repair protein MutS [Cyanobium sp. To12R1]PSJ04652.1 DNA mismatch repair protein MutS [Cyanobium usitatum str. Tous]